MDKKIKVGDLVENCSLMPGVVMRITDDDIEVRMLQHDEYEGQEWTHCSLTACGIVKLTAKEAFDRLKLGKDALSEIWDGLRDYNENDMMEEYNRRIEKAANIS